MSPFGKSEPFQGLRFNLWASDLMGRILLFKTDGAVWGGKTCLYLGQSQISVCNLGQIRLVDKHRI